MIIHEAINVVLIAREMNIIFFIIHLISERLNVQQTTCGENYLRQTIAHSEYKSSQLNNYLIMRISDGLAVRIPNERTNYGAASHLSQLNTVYTGFTPVIC